jgi:hypothetical protein
LNTLNSYYVKKIATPVDIGAGWNSVDWKGVEVVKINNFRAESSNHHPAVECRLQHDGKGFYGLFQVNDKYIRCVATEYNSNVCEDSCVEFFIEPPGGQGYFNFEFNCGGAMLLYHVKDCTITDSSFKNYAPVTQNEVAAVKIFHTMPQVVEPEITEEMTWRLGFYILFALFESKIKGLKVTSGQTWRGNFYKCASKTSHPHWASWNPVSILNFHLQECFGNIVLG